MELNSGDPKAGSHLPPISPLTVLQGILGGEEVNILKDDGCNTNVISRDFANKHRANLDIRECKLSISHSNKFMDEEANEIVYNTTLKIGGTEYTSNWAISDIHYDVILGMPWHIQVEPNISYGTRTITVDKNILPTKKLEKEPTVSITNIGAKRFRSILRKKKGNAEVFMIQQIQAESQNLSQIKKSGQQRSTDNTRKA